MSTSNGYNGTHQTVTIGGVILDKPDPEVTDLGALTSASPEVTPEVKPEGVEYSSALGAVRGHKTRGQRIKALLKYHRMTMGDMALMLGVTTNAVNHWCADRYAPSVANLEKLAQWLEVPAAVIEHGLRAAAESTPVTRTPKPRKRRKGAKGKGKTPTRVEDVQTGPIYVYPEGNTQSAPVRVDKITEPVTVSAVAVEVLPAVTLDPSQVWIIAEVGRLMEQMNTAQRKAVMQVARVLIDTAHGV